MPGFEIKSARFIKSSPNIELCPQDGKPEFAFIGRSNVGKSSLINYLVGRTSLAQTSSTPGKTKTLNYFLINDSWYLVDLPGYGYAKTSKKERETWQQNMLEYIEKRDNLVNVFLLIDGNIPPQEIDLAFCDWLGERQIPFGIVFTKTDKPTKGWLKKNVKDFEAKMLETWAVLPPFFITSAGKKRGREEVLAYIGESLQSFEETKR